MAIFFHPGKEPLVNRPACFVGALVNYLGHLSAGEVVALDLIVLGNPFYNGDADEHAQ